MTTEVSVDVDANVRTITLARPKTRNALTLPVVDRLAEMFEDAARDIGTRVVVFTGTEGAFCSGLDLKTALADPSTLASPAASLAHFHRLGRAVWNCPKPVIAAIDGAAAGYGCDLALACDVRVATKRAFFQESFTKIGLVPDGGGSFLLPRLVGLARASQMILFGEPLSAEEAHRIGLVSFLADDALTFATEKAKALAQGSPRALRHAKRVLRANLEGSFEQGLDREHEAQVACLQGRDSREGVTAFLEKRAPQFENDDGA